LEKKPGNRLPNLIGSKSPRENHFHFRVATESINLSLKEYSWIFFPKSMFILSAVRQSNKAVLNTWISMGRKGTEYPLILNVDY